MGSRHDLFVLFLDTCTHVHFWGINKRGFYEYGREYAFDTSMYILYTWCQLFILADMKLSGHRVITKCKKVFQSGCQWESHVISFDSKFSQGHMWLENMFTCLQFNCKGNRKAGSVFSLAEAQVHVLGNYTVLKKYVAGKRKINVNWKNKKKLLCSGCPWLSLSMPLAQMIKMWRQSMDCLHLKVN